MCDRPPGLSPADVRGAGGADQVSWLGELRRQSQMVKGAPYGTGIGRVDEVTAARKPVLRWKPA
jgi:hypothetical protein